MRSKFFAFGLAMMAASAISSVASASAFDQIFVFGDSLSDNGNAAIALGNDPLAPLPPNYNGSSYTDGLNTVPATTGPLGLWIDQFAYKIGVTDPTPALAGGTNYAVASAQTGANSIQDMGNQVSLYVSTHPVADPNALYVIFGGANDLLDASPGDDPNTVSYDAAHNLIDEVVALQNTGAKNFLWFNVPALQFAPVAIAAGSAEQTFLQTAAENFNSIWALGLSQLRAGGVNIHGVDLYGLMTNIVANPSAYNLTNVTAPAQGLAVDPNQYLFWDGEHPTTAGAALIADAAVAAVPEPSLFFAGIVAVVGLAGRRKR